MNRIFLRVFALAMLAVAVATVAIYFAITYFFGDPFEDIARKQASGPIFLLEEYIDKAPADEWLVRLNKVREISNLSLELVPMNAALAELPADKHASLKEGEIVLDVGRKMFFRRVDRSGERYIGSDEDVLRVARLPIDIGLELKVEALRFLLVALFLLVPIALWSRSHWLELQALSRVADEFGEGKLSSRATTPEDSGIYPLAQCMNHMAERIETLLEGQKSLLHSVSHELRTPIARLGFGLELLRDTTRDDKLVKRIGSMEADLAELDALVNELLNLTRLDQQHALQRDRFTLGDLLHGVVHGVDHLFTEKRLEVRIADNLGDIGGDQRLIARAVSNLLVNAAKYANGRVAISARAADRDTLDILVEDDGPGIPADQREHVFEPFYRLDRSRDRATGGFGLGLAIVRKAVELHGGTVNIGESPLGGAAFAVRLPRGLPAAAGGNDSKSVQEARAAKADNHR